MDKGAVFPHPIERQVNAIHLLIRNEAIMIFQTTQWDE